MNNKKYNKLMRTGVVLTGISVSMFAYQNLIYPNYIESKNLVTVYTASKDIKAGEAITKDMFSAQEIKSSEVIDGMVTDISKVQGKYTKGALFKGEILTEFRLDKKQVDSSQIYTIEFYSEYLSDVTKGDFIAVYVKIKTDDNRLVVRELFPRKEVKMAESPVTSSTGNTNKDGSSKIYITVSEQEMKDYYLAQDRGEIIGVKITSNDIKKAGLDRFDANDEDSLNSIPQDKNSSEGTVSNGEGGIMEYEIQDGDTLESIVVKFKTSESKIKELNNNKSEFNPGEVIYVPA